MTPSLRIARVFGVDIRIHVTFLALVVLLVAWEVLPDTDGGTIPPLVLLALFGLAGLHELGHALVAKRLGVVVQDIVFLPVLLMVRLRLPEKARTELAVAAAGPATNLVLAALLLAVTPLLGIPGTALTEWPPMALLPLVFWVNLLMGTLNLLPAFPMDGGRILRALLALKLPYPVATSVAVRIGWLVVLLGGAAGLLLTGSLVIAVAAVFLLVLGSREEQAVRLRSHTREVLRLRDELRTMGLDGDPAAVSPFGDFRRLRDPGFRREFDLYRRRLEELRTAAGD